MKAGRLIWISGDILASSGRKRGGGGFARRVVAGLQKGGGSKDRGCMRRLHGVGSPFWGVLMTEASSQHLILVDKI